MTLFERSILRQDAAPATPEPMTARVTRSDASGVWVVPIGADLAFPIGPCRGAWRTSQTPLSAPVTGGQGGSVLTHTHGREQLPEGVVVLVWNTSAGPWIIRED